MNTWEARFFGSVELLNPQGTGVDFPNRKVAALFALLALQRDYGCAREEAAQIIWPHSSPENQRNSLKQALSLLRKAIGSESVLSGRDHLRLADGFRLKTDVENAGMRRGRHFMPGFDGWWFDQYRVAPEAENEIAETEPNPHQAFSALANWYLEHNPNRGLAFLSENLGMALGLPGKTRDLIRLARPSNPRWTGWRLFFQGSYELGSKNVVVGGSLCKRAAEHAMVEKDFSLAVQAMTQCALSESLQNRMPRALTTARHCLDIAERSKDRELKATASQMFGNILVHSGDLKEGLYYLEVAEQIYADPVDTLIIQALRAYYLTTYGKVHEGQVVLEALGNANAQLVGHPFLDSIRGSALAQVYLRESAVEPAIAIGNSSLEQAKAMNNNHQIILANETLAIAYHRAGEAQISEQKLTEARRLRQSLSMSMTPWDSARARLVARSA